MRERERERIGENRKSFIHAFCRHGCTDHDDSTFFVQDLVYQKSYHHHLLNLTIIKQAHHLLDQPNRPPHHLSAQHSLDWITAAGGRALDRVGYAKQRPAGRGVPSYLPLLRQAPAVQERRAPISQDDIRAMSERYNDCRKYHKMISV